MNINSKRGTTHGKIDVSFCFDSERSRVEGLYQQNPFRLLIPSSHGREFLEAIVVNTSGGIVGGDVLETHACVKKNAKVIMTTQAAEKVYRSEDDDSTIKTSLHIESGGFLHWMPQETVLFEGARVRRSLTFDVEKLAQLMAGEVLVFGRVARGERLTHGMIHDEWRVKYDGKLVWADNLHLEEDMAGLLDAPFGFNGSRAAATFLYVADDASTWLNKVNDIIQSTECWTGATCIGNVIIARWLGVDAARVRKEYGSFVAEFASLVIGQHFRLPRIWNF